MELAKIINLLEKFAPLNTQEAWDSSGFQIDLNKKEVNKICICLSITEKIINQAIEAKCDMIIAHHPLFFIPLKFNKGIPIYSAHTNLDKTDGGTTDTLVHVLGFNNIKKVGDFLRIVDLDNKVSLDSFIKLIKDKLSLTNVRVVNNLEMQEIKEIAFCAGSGADFLKEVEEIEADVFVTGDVKYHTALESNAIIIDVGHAESEFPVLKTIEELLRPLNLEVILADEKSPFLNY